MVADEDFRADPAASAADPRRPAPDQRWGGDAAPVGIRTQEAATSALRSWADGLQTFAGGESVVSEMPTIRRYFDAVQQILDGQRQFAEAMATAVQTMQTFANQAAHAAKETINAMQTAANGATTVTKAAKEQTSAMARTAKAATG